MKETIKTLFLHAINFIKKHKKIFIISIIIVAIVILILFSISILNNNKIGNSTCNLRNKGIAAIEDNKIYYIQTGENKGIYRLKGNNDKSKKIVDGIAYYLNLYKNYLYYIELNEKDLEFNVIKIKANGKDKQTFIKNVDLNMLTVVDNWVYFCEDKELYRIRTNGKDKIKICEDEVSNYKVEGNYIYYIYFNGEKNILARKTLEGKSFLKLSENVSEDFDIIGNRIYFIEQKYNSEKQEYEHNLYKMKKNGKSRKQILELPSSIVNVNILKDRIYYTALEDYEEYKIYKHDYKENKANLLKDVKSRTDICLVGEYIFYTDLDKNSENTVFRMVKD